MRIAVCFATVLSLTAPPFALSTDDKVLNDRNGNPFMEEAAPANETLVWQYVYSSYSCVYHHNYALATRWLLYALKQGAGGEMLRASTDIAYLSQELSAVAAKRKEAAVPETSGDAQVLQALMQTIVGNRDDAIDMLKRVVLNNPTYSSLPFLKAKIRALEFEQSDTPWITPPDVAQTGGKSNRFSKWKMNKFPLKIYIPTDKEGTKVAGYRTGDGQLLRSALKHGKSKAAARSDSFTNQCKRELISLVRGSAIKNCCQLPMPLVYAVAGMT